MSAADESGNVGNSSSDNRRQFEVVRAFRPKTIEELLSPSAYLRELQNFVRGHIVKPADPDPEPSAVDSSDLLKAFKQPIAEIGQSDVATALHPICDLLTPIRVMRDVDRARALGNNRDCADTAGLIARWNFADLQIGAPDGMADVAARFNVRGQYHGIGARLDYIERMRGRAGTDLEGALVLDGQSYAEVSIPAAKELLQLGRDNQDFGVSLWIYPQDTGAPGGPWRQVIYKGHEQPDRNRTFGIWLAPDSNMVVFQITTTSVPINGDGSSKPIPVGKWTHLAYVKSGQRLNLYINGQLDRSVVLVEPVVSNLDPLFVGGNPGMGDGLFRGGLSEIRIYDFALEKDAVAHLAADRLSGPSSTPVPDYLKLAYETLLRGLGTSLEELRGLRGMTQPRRLELAGRLGLAYPNQTGDLLNSLVTELGIGDDGMFEEWLAGTFGLPQTFTPTPQSPSAFGVTALMRNRRDSLSYRWMLQDADRLGMPELDPDLVDIADLSPRATDWVTLQRSREAEMARKFNDFKRALNSPGIAIASVVEGMGLYSDRDLLFLQELASRERRGESIAEDLVRIGLTTLMFRRLLGYLELRNVTLTSHESEDLAHLLTQIWKLRRLYSGWQQQEAALSTKLWPSLASEGAWVLGSPKQGLLPWRGTAQQRSDLEARLAARLRAWQDIQDAQDQAVAEAQRVALPILRDGLLGIGDLPSAQSLLDDLSQRWLVDFGTSGSTFVTPVDQATSSLQYLINGVRGKWFEQGHPAHQWGPRTQDEYDKQWTWIDTYGRWRAAVLNYLYPENVLYPELRDKNSMNFNNLLEALRKLQPISVSLVEDPESSVGKAFHIVKEDGTANNAPAELKEEAFVFAPMAEGLAFQRASLFTEALEKYREFYDWTVAAADRKLYEPLKSEPDNSPPNVNFSDQNWASDLRDPHTQTRKSGCQNPYTRFTLFQILHCILAQADDAFTSGSRDGRTLALGLYLEARDILGFEELQDAQPTDPTQAYLPSPVLESLRAHTDSALRKLRHGLSFLGTPVPPDLTRGPGAAAVSSLVRPTPYRYRVLIERAKQLVAQSQQIEGQYFAAIEGGDREAERLLATGFQLDSAKQVKRLKSLQNTEAQDGKNVAIAQQARSRIQSNRYRMWIASGPTENERAQIANIWDGMTARNVIAGLDSSIAAGERLQSITGDISAVLWWQWALEAAVDAQIAGRALTQMIANYHDAQSQVSGILASQERRSQEWLLNLDLADQDVSIGEAQIKLAQDRIDIAAQEYTIANTQISQAQQMLAFLKNKTTSAAFYQWLLGDLGQIYATFLRLATATARHAELQIAFERQERPAGFIRADYWQLAQASAKAASSSGSQPGAGPVIDPKGITGSARLLQDIFLLDERAFTSERRLLNLTQSFSLSRLMPIEFEEFRRTGQLAFSTPMRWFDEGFPGHYMRLIKKARISVAALIAPGHGIRATLANSGMSRVVTADAGYPTIVIRQDPQVVALTSPIASTGVFEFDIQGDLLFPFEGTGVDTTWLLELPPAGNAFDFDTLMEVVLSIDYTAQFSPDLRDRVVKSLPQQMMGDRTFSVKRDFPDAWYEMANSSTEHPTFTIPLSTRNIPAGLKETRVNDVALSARTIAGKPCSFKAVLTATLPDNTVINGGVAVSVSGIASSRQSGGAAWRDLLTRFPALAEDVARFELQLESQPLVSPGDPPSFVQQLQDGTVADILFVATFSGSRPRWT